MEKVMGPALREVGRGAGRGFTDCEMRLSEHCTAL